MILCISACDNNMNSDLEVMLPEGCVVNPEIEFPDCPAEGVSMLCPDIVDGELVPRELICRYFVGKFGDDGFFNGDFPGDDILGSTNTGSCEIMDCNTLRCNLSVCETPPCDPDNIVTTISALLTVTFEDLIGFENAIFEGPAVIDNEDGFYGGCG